MEDAVALESDALVPVPKGFDTNTAGRAVTIIHSDRSVWPEASLTVERCLPRFHWYLALSTALSLAFGHPLLLLSSPTLGLFTSRHRCLHLLVRVVQAWGATATGLRLGGRLQVA